MTIHTRPTKAVRGRRAFVRLNVPIDPDAGPRAALEAQAAFLIDLLDRLDGDVDLEPQCEDEGAQCDDEGSDADGEGSLGAPEGARYWPPCGGLDLEQEARVAPKHRPERLRPGARFARDAAELRSVEAFVRKRHPSHDAAATRVDVDCFPFRPFKLGEVRP